LQDRQVDFGHFVHVAAGSGQSIGGCRFDVLEREGLCVPTRRIF